MTPEQALVGAAMAAWKQNLGSRHTPSLAV